MKVVEHENVLIFKPGTRIRSKFPDSFIGRTIFRIEYYKPYCSPVQQKQCMCKTGGVIFRDSNGNVWCLYANTHTAANFNLPLGTLMWEKVDEDR